MLRKALPLNCGDFRRGEIAKNHNSQIHHSLAKVKANMRLGLTGTPIEELPAGAKIAVRYRLTHLYAQSHRLPPPLHQADRKRGERTEKAAASRYINPFILRRRKRRCWLICRPKPKSRFTAIFRSIKRCSTSTLQRNRSAASWKSCKTRSHPFLISIFLPFCLILSRFATIRPSI